MGKVSTRARDCGGPVVRDRPVVRDPGNAKMKSEKSEKNEKSEKWGGCQSVRPGPGTFRSSETGSPGDFPGGLQRAPERPPQRHCSQRAPHRPPQSTPQMLSSTQRSPQSNPRMLNEGSTEVPPMLCPQELSYLLWRFVSMKQ